MNTQNMSSTYSVTHLNRKIQNTKAQLQRMFNKYGF